MKLKEQQTNKTDLTPAYQNLNGGSTPLKMGQGVGLWKQRLGGAGAERDDESGG